MRSANQRLLRRPRHKASVDGGLESDRSADAVGDACSMSESGSTATATSRSRVWLRPGFTVVNVAADYKVNEYAKVFARIDNLFDERYEDPTGFLRPGLAVYGGVRLTN